jgi:hypothetical protein
MHALRTSARSHLTGLQHAAGVCIAAATRCKKQARKHRSTQNINCLCLVGHLLRLTTGDTAQRALHAHKASSSVTKAASSALREAIICTFKAAQAQNQGWPRRMLQTTQRGRAGTHSREPGGRRHSGSGTDPTHRQKHSTCTARVGRLPVPMRARLQRAPPARQHTQPRQPRTRG